MHLLYPYIYALSYRMMKLSAVSKTLNNIFLASRTGVGIKKWTFIPVLRPLPFVEFTQHCHYTWSPTYTYLTYENTLPLRAVILQAALDVLSCSPASWVTTRLWSLLNLYQQPLIDILWNMSAHINETMASLTPKAARPFIMLKIL